VTHQILSSPAERPFGLRPIREEGCRLEALWLGDRLVDTITDMAAREFTLALECGNQVADLIRNEFRSTAAEVTQLACQNTTAAMGTSMSTAGELGSS
jgi:hypothetical protein